jgi:hypothetical protein
MPPCGTIRDDVTRGNASLGPTDARWWRAVMKRSGAYVALLALALQLALSFGHTHARDFAGLGLHRATADALQARRGPLLAQSVQRLPATQSDDDENCPICFSGLLLATSFVPVAAQPSPAFDLTDATRSVRLSFDGVAQVQRAPFQSRAPPPS